MQTSTMIMAPLGIVAIVALTWLFGGRRNAAADDGRLRALLIADYPDVTIEHACATRDGCGIFYCGNADDDARFLGIVRRVGDGFSVRCFRCDEVRMTVSEDAVVKLRFPDPAFPPLRLRAEETPPWLRAGREEGMA